MEQAARAAFGVGAGHTASPLGEALQLARRQRFRTPCTPTLPCTRPSLGYRFQIHVQGDHVKLFTRNSNDFSERGYDVLAPAVLAQLAPGVSAAVLDCELLVWNVKHRRPEPFNLLRPAMTAAMNPDGADMDEVLNMAGAQMGVLPPGVGCDAAYEPPRLRDVTLLFAVFDVLRVNDDVHVWQ